MSGNDLDVHWSAHFLRGRRRTYRRRQAGARGILAAGVATIAAPQIVRRR